jgi:hypothetical protein
MDALIVIVGLAVVGYVLYKKGVFAKIKAKFDKE